MNPKFLSREQNLYLAKLAEEAERYDDMAAHMEALILSCSGELSVEERNLFSVACRSAVASRCDARRVVFSDEQKAGSNASLVRSYRDRIEAELEYMCRNFLTLIESRLLPSAASPESRVFYLKMKGDYYRYLSEFKVGEPRMDVAWASMQAYEAAQKIAFVDLAPTQPLRLAVALNFSIYCVDILNWSERACFLAKQAYEEALSDPDGLLANKDSILITRRLQDNLTLWTSDAAKDPKSK